ncbi:type IV secretory system conjugative DNA transfer family protein [Tropicibacter sp. R15_0]|uniref:type IV secretory system conjugative DNA transfer family protein n=1 Tax=Tropicibacter sp. R15_0 TaxID=2821101 RepID=UPI001ADC7A44|nr:type IV secretory system conjugative DNA transfer family protein [Tropicibacter sp. R15_0]MBO9466724.1 type IV secretory system conjugative DNA transfer family protein [Tropicibacter sp. R15_0]
MAFPFFPRSGGSSNPRQDNEANRFGSSRFATYQDLLRAGLFEQRPESFFVGYFEGREVWFSGPAGLCLVAGARAGKMRDVICRNLLSGTCKHTLMMLDPKGEGAYLSQDQTADGKFCAYWNPVGLHDLPQDRVNPLDYLRIDSPTLVSDTKVLWEELAPSRAGSKDDFFPPRCREFGEALSLVIAEIMEVVTWPALYEAVNALIAGGEDWLELAYQMSQSRFSKVRQIEAEIATARADSTGGFRGILGELSKSVACLSDPVLMDSVSPPYTMSLSDLVDDNQAWQFYVCPPAEYLQAWSPVLKTFFVGATLYKSRAPAARRITFILDECGQLGGESGGFPLVPRLFTYGAGIGIQPIAVFQTEDQMDNLGPNAKAQIKSSAAGKLMFALRDWGSAKSCADMCGSQTLVYDDRLAQERATHARNTALHSVINGGDPLRTALEISHQSFATEHQAKQHRQLQTVDEVMNAPSDMAYFFHEDVPYPIPLTRRPYWEVRGLTYHPNPYHPPLDSVQVQTFWGKRTRRVITEPVPESYAHYPQYRSGVWSYVER